MKRAKLANLVRRTLQGSSPGVTLVEVLIAIALIGAILTAFLSTLSAATAALIINDQRATAESLARSQMEFVKSQGYNSSRTYLKIPNIPAGYEIWSINSINSTVRVVNGGPNDDVLGVFWNSTGNRPALNDTGLQKIALLIRHQGKDIYTFVNNNTWWATGANITLEGYVRDS